ncbi:MAG: nucleoside hydrolase [Candidatus Aenigmarchaeota archaeon]|nr:nucleoside hydrolase [Candidatus Aenigmarchaeota archaeon]
MPERLLVVTDPMNDCDDMVALYMLKHPEVRCEGLIATYGNASTRAKAAKKFLLMANRDVPVFYSNNAKKMPYSPYHMEEADYNFLTRDDLHATDADSGISPDGEDFMERIIKSNPGQISILSIAPLTVLASVLRRAGPQSVKTIYLMGGHVGKYLNMPDPPYYRAKAPEYNFECDPDAARNVILSGAHIKTVGKNLWAKDLFTVEDFEPLSRGSMPQKKIFDMIMARYAHNKKNLEPLGIGVELFMYDPITLGVVLFPELYDFERIEMVVDENGITHTKPAKEGNVYGAVDADLVEIKKRLLNLIAG